jgi:hypothetical protein
MFHLSTENSNVNGVALGREHPGVIEGVVSLCFLDGERHRGTNNHLNNKRRTTHIKHLLA